MRRNSNFGFLLHPFQHIVDAANLHGLSGCVPADIDEQAGLALQQFPVFYKVMHQELESVIADPAPPEFCILCPRIILVILAEPHTDRLVLVVDVPCVIDSKYFSDPEACLCKQEDQ